MRLHSITRRLRGTVAAAAATAAAATAALTVGAPSAAAAPALAPAWYGATPYVMPLENDPPDLASVMRATGQKSFQLAFVLASGSACAPAWDGTAPVASDTRVAGVVDQVRAAGGDVSVSIGGYGGTKLGQVCTSPQTTAAAYQQVITKYALGAIDFDLEEPEYEDATAIANEVGAAQILARADPGLVVSVTIPGTTSGTGWFGQQVLNTAKGLGFTPHDYSIMPFDGGFNGAASQVAALEAFHTMLTATFGWDSTTAYAHEGVSLMNGRTDAGEHFTQSDFQTVLDYATSHRLARYTFWSVNRDRPCTPVDNQVTSGTCSSVAQAPWDFTRFTSRFAGATPAPSPTPAPPAGSCPVAWNATTAYAGGTAVGYGGHRWTARWWTYGDRPGANAQAVWVDAGPC